MRGLSGIVGSGSLPMMCSWKYSRSGSCDFLNLSSEEVSSLDQKNCWRRCVGVGQQLLRVIDELVELALLAGARGRADAATLGWCEVVVRLLTECRQET